MTVGALPDHWSPEQINHFFEVKAERIARHFAPAHADEIARKRAETFKPKPNGKRSREPDDLQPPPKGESILALVEREMPAISYLCEPWAPEGLNLIVGRPKLGKTTLMRQKMAAIAAGGEFWGSPTVQTPCVYLSLEEGDRLTRTKFEMANFDRKALSNIEVFFNWQRGEEGRLDLIRLLDARPEVRGVYIDSLTRFRAVPDARTPAFQADYDAVNGLHEVAKARHGVAIDVVHHSRKMKSEDPIEDISGTYGLSAACDSYWIMRHHEDGAVVHVGGRLWDRDAHQFTLKRGQQRWELVGEFDSLSDVQRNTLEVLRKSGGQTPTDAAKFWSISRQSAMERLAGLVRNSSAYKNNEGTYFAK